MVVVGAAAIEAVDVSLALVADRQRIVTIAAFGRADREGIQAIGGTMPRSAAFRDEVRPRLIALAADGRLVVPVARTFPLDAAPEALALLRAGTRAGSSRCSRSPSSECRGPPGPTVRPSRRSPRPRSSAELGHAVHVAVYRGPSTYRLQSAGLRPCPVIAQARCRE